MSVYRPFRFLENWDRIIFNTNWWRWSWLECWQSIGFAYACDCNNLKYHEEDKVYFMTREQARWAR